MGWPDQTTLARFIREHFAKGTLSFGRLLAWRGSLVG